MIWRWIPAGVVLLASALAFGPKEALAYTSPELGPANAALEAAKTRALAGNVGLGSQLSANRNDGYNSYTAGLNWQWNFAARLELALGVSRAERTVRQTGREGIKNALLVHANLWAAQSKQASAQKRLEIAQARLQAAEQKLNLGAISASQREEAVLGVKQAELAVRQAQNGLKAAQTEGMRYGLGVTAEVQVLRFALHDALPEQNPSYLEALAAAQQAQAKLDEATRSLLPQLSFGAAYVGTNTQLQTNLSWQGSGPGASVLFGNVPYSIASLPTDPISGLKPGQGTWNISLGATLSLAPEAIAGIGQLEAERDRSVLRAQRTLDEARLRLVQAQGEAGIAFESMSLAQTRLELAKRQLALVEARTQAGSTSTIDFLEAQAAALEADGGVAQAWQAYIGSVANYLDWSDGEWSVEGL